MNIKQITSIARSRGVKPRKLNKSSLIRTIQLKEGNFDCYGSAYTGECDQHKCTWRDDCISEAMSGKEESDHIYAVQV
jgi:hypothetical protein